MCRATEPGSWMQDKVAADLYRQHRGALLGAHDLLHSHACHVTRYESDMECSVSIKCLT